MKNRLSFNLLITFSILLLMFLVVGQSFSLVNYDWAVSVGLQESESEITKLGIAWAKAFALGDTLVYIPLLITGIIGLRKKTLWGFVAMLGSLSISIYWPIVNLSAIYIGRDELALLPEKYTSFTIVLPIITLYGIWGMWYLFRHYNDFIPAPNKLSAKTTIS